MSTSGVKHLDVGYSALWDKHDLKLISKKFAKIAELTHELKNLSLNYMIYNEVEKFLCQDIKDEVRILRHQRSKLVDDFDEQLERNFNDQTSELEPLEVNKQFDRVVASGMGRIAEFVVGESTEFFDHFAAGISISPVYASDTELIEEIARVSIDTQGYATASGAVIKYGAYFAPNVQTAEISEAGVFDSPEGGTMLFRTVYPLNKVINHTQSITFFTLSHAIYQSSI